MTNKEKALALINTFVTGNTAKAKELLASGYIQHNAPPSRDLERKIGI